MKKLLITLLACGALVGCNSGSSDDNSSSSDDKGTYIMSFDPSELTLLTGKSKQSTLGLINTKQALDITVPVTFAVSNESAVSVNPTSCTLSPYAGEQYCYLTVTKLKDTTDDVIIHPVLPESYSYVEVVDLIVHSESAESAQ